MTIDSSLCYSINDLVALTGLPNRTIHFYIKEKVIPPPRDRGGYGKKYGEEHLVKLQMIKILQGHDLKLKGIKPILNDTPLEELKAMASGAEALPASWDSAALKSLVAPDQEPPPPQNFSFARIGSTPAPPAATNILTKVHRQAQPRDETWTRIVIMDGVELHLRGDVPDAVRTQAVSLIAPLRRQP